MTSPETLPEDAIAVALVSDDPASAEAVSAALNPSATFELAVLSLPPSAAAGPLGDIAPKLVIIDLGAGGDDDQEALGPCVDALAANTPVIVLAERCEAGLVRCMMRYRIADFLVKPVVAADLLRTCYQVLGNGEGEGRIEAEIRTFLPAAGGVGTTTLALQAASILHKRGKQAAYGTCVVDLNFQHGSCADYLDIEPRFDVDEIENSPERLDRQLLEVMLSKHSSGLSVIAAPHEPTEMRSFKPEVVIRLLDLVSSHFTHVVIDMPRIWFPWTETVLLGSNKLYVVADMTVPCIRNAERLVEAIRGQTGAKAEPGVIVNRYEQKMFDGGLKRSDIQDVLKHAFLGGVANNYALVREAVDKGAPLDEIKARSNISADLQSILFADEVGDRARRPWLGFLPRARRRAA